MAKKQQNPLTVRKGLSANAWTTIAIAVVAVLVIGGVLIFNQRDSTGPGPRVVPAEMLRKPDSNLLTQASNNTVTVVEFLDYQCPACESYYQNVTKKLEQDYADRITFVTRNFPLEIHPLAIAAGKAAEAAALQGKYHEMYDKLYSGYRAWAVTGDGQTIGNDRSRAQDRFETYAQEIGLDLPRFRADAASPAVQQRIDRDLADGKQADITGTPMIFVNGTKFAPTGKAYDAIAEELRGRIDRALEG